MKKKIIIIAIIIVAIIIGTILIINGNKKDNNKTISQNTQTTENVSNSATNNDNKDVSTNNNVNSKTTNSTKETKFNGTVEDGVFCITGVESDAEEIIVPSQINGVTVGKIKKNAFYNLKCKKITIPDSVTYIGENAFFCCSDLEQIGLGKGLKSIGLGAFSGCLALKSVTFPEGMETIENPLFINNDELEEVFIPASVVNLPERIASNKTCPKIVIVTPAGSKAEAAAKGQGLTVRNK